MNKLFFGQVANNINLSMYLVESWNLIVVIIIFIFPVDYKKVRVNPQFYLIRKGLYSWNSGQLKTPTSAVKIPELVVPGHDINVGGNAHPNLLAAR